MCRFWNSVIFEVPALTQYDYIMRLDTDALLTTLMAADPFVAMDTQGAVYGYKCVVPDYPAYTHQMANFTLRFMSSRKLTAKFPGFGTWLKSATAGVDVDGESYQRLMFVDIFTVRVAFDFSRRRHKIEELDSDAVYKFRNFRHALF